MLIVFLIFLILVKKLVIFKTLKKEKFIKKFLKYL